MTAYRDATSTCPSCGSPLRVFGARWVCDHCQGMLIGEDDFAKAVHELDGSSAPLVVGAPQAGDKPCPACGAETSTCTLAIGKISLPGRFLHCTTHGVWMPQEVMTSVFARVSRRVHLGVGGNRAYGGVGGGASWQGPQGGMNAAMASIAQAFGGAPADSGLAIASGRGIAHVHSVYVSTYKDRTLACPVCSGKTLDYHGDRWDCAGCGGSFVEQAALVGMIQDITGAPWQLPAAPTTAGSRTCPLCSEAMVTEAVERVEIDRCARHGVWFDARELATLLERAGSQEPPRGLGGWLARVFHRGT